MLSGALDPVTPPASAEVAGEFLANARHLIAKNLGHNVTMYGCAPRLMAEFLSDPTAPLDGGCLDDIEIPPFVYMQGDVP